MAAAKQRPFSTQPTRMKCRFLTRGGQLPDGDAPKAEHGSSLRHAEPDEAMGDVVTTGRSEGVEAAAQAREGE